MSKQEKIGLGLLVGFLTLMALLLVLTFKSPGGDGKPGTPSKNPLVEHVVEKHR